VRSKFIKASIILTTINIIVIFITLLSTGSLENNHIRLYYDFSQRLVRQPYIDRTRRALQIAIETRGLKFGEELIKQVAVELLSSPEVIQALKASGVYKGLDLSQLQKIIIMPKRWGQKIKIFKPGINLKEQAIILYVSTWALMQEDAERIRTELSGSLLREGLLPEALLQAESVSYDWTMWHTGGSIFEGVFETPSRPISDQGQIRAVIEDVLENDKNGLCTAVLKALFGEGCTVKDISRRKMYFLQEGPHQFIWLVTVWLKPESAQRLRVKEMDAEFILKVSKAHPGMAKVNNKDIDKVNRGEFKHLLRDSEISPHLFNRPYAEADGVMDPATGLILYMFAEPVVYNIAELRNLIRQLGDKLLVPPGLFFTVYHDDKLRDFVSFHYPSDISRLMGIQNIAAVVEHWASSREFLGTTTGIINDDIIIENGDINAIIPKEVKQRVLARRFLPQGWEPEVMFLADRGEAFVTFSGLMDFIMNPIDRELHSPGIPLFGKEAIETVVYQSFGIEKTWRFYYLVSDRRWLEESVIEGVRLGFQRVYGEEAEEYLSEQMRICAIEHRRNFSLAMQGLQNWLRFLDKIATFLAKYISKSDAISVVALWAGDYVLRTEASEINAEVAVDNFANWWLNPINALGEDLSPEMSFGVHSLKTQLLSELRIPSTELGKKLIKLLSRHEVINDLPLLGMDKFWDRVGRTANYIIFIQANWIAGEKDKARQYLQELGEKLGHSKLLKMIRQEFGR